MYTNKVNENVDENAHKVNVNSPKGNVNSPKGIVNSPGCGVLLVVQSHRSPMPLPNFRNGPRRPARCCGASVGTTGSAPSARSRPWSVKKPPTTIQIGLDFSWVRWCLWCSPVCGVCGDVLFVLFVVFVVMSFLWCSASSSPRQVHAQFSTRRTLPKIWQIRSMPNLKTISRRKTTGTQN